MIFNELRKDDKSEILKNFYMINTDDIVNAIDKRLPQSELLTQIMDVVIKKCNVVLSISPEEFFRSEEKAESVNTYLVLDYLLNTKREKSNYVSYAKFSESFSNDFYQNNSYLHLNDFVEFNPLNTFLNAEESENQHKIPDFLPMAYIRIIHFTNKCPYSKLSNITYDNLEHFFKDIIYGELPGKRKNSKYLFCTSKNQSDEKEILSYYLLERFYDAHNLLYIARKVDELVSPLKKEDIIKVLYQTILIPDTFDKKYYIDSIFKVLSKTSEVHCNYKTKDTDVFAHFVEKKSYIQIALNNLIACEKYIKFLSFVYFPVVSACFEVVYNKIFMDNTRPLLNYLKNKNILDIYKSRYEELVKTFIVTKEKSKSENIFVLNSKTKKYFSELYKLVKAHCFNKNDLYDIINRTSINYCYYGNPFQAKIMYTAICEKIELFDNRFTSPAAPFKDPPLTVDEITYKKWPEAFEIFRKTERGKEWKDVL